MKRFRVILSAGLLLLSFSAYPQDAPKMSTPKLVLVDHLPEGATVIAAPASAVPISELAALPAKSHFVFKGVKGLALSMTDTDCEPNTEGCDADGHIIGPPDPNCADGSSPYANCWYLGWGWYICYVGC